MLILSETLGIWKMWWVHFRHQWLRLSESALWAAWKNVITDSERCNEARREANRVNKWREVPICHLCPLAGSFFFIVSCLNSFISLGFRFEWNVVEQKLPTALNQILFPLKSSWFATKDNYDESMWFFYGVILPTPFENPALDLSPYISSAYREEESSRQINPAERQWWKNKVALSTV